MPASPDMKGMTGAPVTHGMHGMYAPPVDSHTLLTAWPVSLVSIVALGGAVWAAHRALVVWRRGTPRSPSWMSWAGLSAIAVLICLRWAVTTPHGSLFSYGMTVAEVLAGYYYLSGVHRLSQRGRIWPAFRTACFLSGLVVVAIALQSPISTLVASSFEYHVVQHMLLMVVAAPLLALSAPMTLALQTTTHHTKVILLRVLNGRVFAAITFPATVWFLYYGVMFAFFLTPLIAVAMDHMALMDALNILFLLGACNFWWPTVGIDNNPRWKMTHGMRIINLLIGVPFESFLGIALLGGGAAAPIYTVTQTHIGGGMVWAIGEVSAFVGTGIVMIQWMRDDQRLAVREDRRTLIRQRQARQQEARQQQARTEIEPAPIEVASATSAFEEAYLARGIPVPVTLADDYRS